MATTEFGTSFYRLVDSDGYKWLVEAHDPDEARGFVLGDGSVDLQGNEPKPYSIESCRRLPGGAQRSVYDHDFTGITYPDGFVGIEASEQVY